MSLLLLDDVVSLNVKSCTVVWFQVGIGRFRPESAKVGWKMPVVDDDRITCCGVLRKPVWQQNMRAEVNIFAPEFTEQFAFHADMFDVVRIFRRYDLCNLLVHANIDVLRAAGANLYFDGLRVEISGLAIPALTFATIWRQAHNFAIGQVKIFVSIQQRLYVIFCPLAPRIDPATESRCVKHRWWQHRRTPSPQHCARISIVYQHCC